MKFEFHCFFKYFIHHEPITNNIVFLSKLIYSLQNLWFVYIYVCYIAGADLSIQEGSPPTAIPEGRFSIYLIQLPSVPRSTVTLQLSAVDQNIYLSEYIFVFQPDNWNISQVSTVSIYSQSGYYLFAIFLGFCCFLCK